MAINRFLEIKLLQFSRMNQKQKLAYILGSLKLPSKKTVSEVGLTITGLDKPSFGGMDMD